MEPDFTQNQNNNPLNNISPQPSINPPTPDLTSSAPEMPDPIDFQSRQQPVVPAPQLSQISPDLQTTMQPSRKKTGLTILICCLVALVLVGGGFIISELMGVPKPKTINQFEQIISQNGYEKVENDIGGYSGPEGSYVMYMKAEDTAADGLAMFYDVATEDGLYDLINEEVLSIDNEMSDLFKDFDWNKSYNKKEKCTENNAHVFICMDVIQVKNTMLTIYYHSDSEEKVHSEINQVISAMGYNF